MKYVPLPPTTTTLSSSLHTNTRAHPFVDHYDVEAIAVARSRSIRFWIEISWQRKCDKNEKYD